MVQKTRHQDELDWAEHSIRVALHRKFDADFGDLATYVRYGLKGAPLLIRTLFAEELLRWSSLKKGDVRFFLAYGPYTKFASALRRARDVPDNIREHLFKTLNQMRSPKRGRRKTRAAVGNIRYMSIAVRSFLHKYGEKCGELQLDCLVEKPTVEYQKDLRATLIRETASEFHVSEAVMLKWVSTLKSKDIDPELNNVTIKID